METAEPFLTNRRPRSDTFTTEASDIVGIHQRGIGTVVGTDRLERDRRRAHEADAPRVE